MADLKVAFEAAGFSEMKTVLSSGNVLFSSPAASVASLQKKAEAAMANRLGRSFLTIVRPVAGLRALLDSDPYRGFRLIPGSKRVVTFLRATPRVSPKLPIELHGARILVVAGGEAFSAYVPTPKGPVFMVLLKKTFGTEQTT